MRAVPILIATLLCTTPSIAQVTDGQRVSQVLKDGLIVSIVDDAGVQIEGRVDTFSEQMVRISRSGRSIDIPVDRIVRIVRPDGVANGALTGFGVGFGMVYFVRARANPGRDCHRCWFQFAVGQGLLAAGIGAAIDASFDNTEVLYTRGRRARTRIAPIVARGDRGAAISVSW